ncbi:MAG TPA: hypothetical protein VN937_04140 [Blastocatellia bacterium]|nr:hypothetical protein [Blastocatellia bacterium]
MITREKIIEELNKMPDEHLEDLYKVIKSLETNGTREEAGETVMAKLRKIKISASPDLSIRAKLYDLEGEDAE